MSCEVIEKIGTGDCELNKNCTSDSETAHNIVTELVFEILENALDIAEDKENQKATSHQVGGDIMDKLSNKFQEMKLSENVIPTEAVCARPLKGLGDQLKQDDLKEETTPKHPPVEKKNRLTDLVKNSKNILSKLILSESKGAAEDKAEKVLRVIELDSGDPPFKVSQQLKPEDFPLPRCNSTEILRSDEDKMDEIDLKTTSDKTTETMNDVIKKTMTFPLASSSSSKTSSLMAKYRTFKLTGEIKTKKWNIGSKLMKYIKKKQSPKKEDDDKEEKASDGVEIRPDEA